MPGLSIVGGVVSNIRFDLSIAFLFLERAVAGLQFYGLLIRIGGNRYKEALVTVLDAKALLAIQESRDRLRVRGSRYIPWRLDRRARAYSLRKLL
jgi:hypothetical protein